MQLRTLADLKRAIAVPGVVLTLTENTAAPQPPDHPAWLPRTIGKVQTTCFHTIVGGKKWWMDFGKAREWNFNGNTATRSIPAGRITFRLDETEASVS